MIRKSQFCMELGMKLKKVVFSGGGIKNGVQITRCLYGPEIPRDYNIRKGGGEYEIHHHWEEH